MCLAVHDGGGSLNLYIDESGDPGMHVERHGTSPHFVVAGVIVKDDGALERCRMGLDRFKADRRIQRREFKFN